MNIFGKKSPEILYTLENSFEYLICSYSFRSVRWCQSQTSACVLIEAQLVDSPVPLFYAYMSTLAFYICLNGPWFFMSIDETFGENRPTVSFTFNCKYYVANLFTHETLKFSIPIRVGTRKCLCLFFYSEQWTVSWYFKSELKWMSEPQRLIKINIKGDIYTYS